MRLTYIAAGAGMMYCGACARDLALIRELLARGHDVQVYSLYTPLRFDGGDPLPAPRIAFGGINVYLQQQSGFFARLPRWLTRWLDHPALLRWAAGYALRTSPAQLGPLTVSMLAGRDGRQQTELQRLLGYIDAGECPDAVIITNALLSGIAPAIKARLGLPLLCLVQGEDLFVDGLPEPHRTRARQSMRAHAAAVDLYLAPGADYARYMADFLQAAPDQVQVARAGVDLQAYLPGPPPPADPFIIGYLSVIVPNKGLDLLIDALRLLVHGQGRQVQLHVAGKVLDSDYHASVRHAIDAAALADRVHLRGEVDFAEKIAFLQACSVFCVPSQVAESRGIAALEALACGTPALMPAAGIFPEIHALTGAGELFQPGDPHSLAAACTRVMDDLQRAREQVRVGHAGLETHFSATRMADDLLAACVRVITSRASAGVPTTG